MGTVSMAPDFTFSGSVEADVERARRLVDGEPAQARCARLGMRLAFSSIGR